MIQIIEWRPANKNSLKGNFDIIVEKWGGFIIRDLAYFQKGNQSWISFPSRSSEVLGQKKYFSYCTFHNAQMKKLFFDKVKTSLEEFLKKENNGR